MPIITHYLIFPTCLDNELLWAQKEDIIKQIDVYCDQIQFKQESINDLDVEINTLQEEENSIDGDFLLQNKDEYKSKIDILAKKSAS